MVDLCTWYNKAMNLDGLVSNYGAFLLHGAEAYYMLAEVLIRDGL